MYCEVSDPLTFPETLAAEVGMKLDPFGFVDLVLGYTSPECALYDKIPEGSFQVLNYVISIIRKSAVMFKEKYCSIKIF